MIENYSSYNLALFAAINCVMGEWTTWSSCICIHGTCGLCETHRESHELVRCANGGRCDCERKEEAKDCSKPCSKWYNIYY